MSQHSLQGTRHPAPGSIATRRAVGWWSVAILACATAICLVPSALAQAANPRRTPVVEVVERVRGAVVNIHSERTTRLTEPDEFLAGLLPSQNRVNGMGTGILIDSRGYIVTNQHVVDDVHLIRVRLSDGTAHSARVIAREFEADLALLKIDTGRTLPTMPLGTASDILVGETVIAIGNAFGYEHTVSAGVVSAVKRDVTLNKDMAYKSLIQTDASINPGNSGGPLLNINGELVGVNVAIRAGAQGIGFAIPVDTMIRVTADMLSNRRRGGVWHGLTVRDGVESALTRAATESETVRVKAGSWQTKRELVVEHLEPASPAAKAGLQKGDVLLQVGEQSVLCSLDLERAFLDRAAGDKLAVVVRRAEGEHRLEVALIGERVAAATGDVIWRKLGVRVNPVAADAVIRTSRQLHGGVVIADLNPQGAAARAGIQRGDILVGLHQWETLSLDNITFVLTHQELPTFLPLRFYIVRGGQIHRGQVAQLD